MSWRTSNAMYSAHALTRSSGDGSEWCSCGAEWPCRWWGVLRSEQLERALAASLADADALRERLEKLAKAWYDHWLADRDCRDTHRHRDAPNRCMFVVNLFGEAWRLTEAELAQARAAQQPAGGEDE